MASQSTKDLADFLRNTGPPEEPTSTTKPATQTGGFLNRLLGGKKKSAPTTTSASQLGVVVGPRISFHGPDALLPSPAQQQDSLVLDTAATASVPIPLGSMLGLDGAASPPVPPKDITSGRLIAAPQTGSASSSLDRSKRMTLSELDMHRMASYSSAEASRGSKHRQSMLAGATGDFGVPLPTFHLPLPPSMSPSSQQQQQQQQQPPSAGDRRDSFLDMYHEPEVEQLTDSTSPADKKKYRKSAFPGSLPSSSQDSDSEEETATAVDTDTVGFGDWIRDFSTKLGNSTSNSAVTSPADVAPFLPFADSPGNLKPSLSESLSSGSLMDEIMGSLGRPGSGSSSGAEGTIPPPLVTANTTTSNSLEVEPPSTEALSLASPSVPVVPLKVYAPPIAVALPPAVEQAPVSPRVEVIARMTPLRPASPVSVAVPTIAAKPSPLPMPVKSSPMPMKPSPSPAAVTKPEEAPAYGKPGVITRSVPTQLYRKEIGVIVGGGSFRKPEGRKQMNRVRFSGMDLMIPPEDYERRERELEWERRTPSKVGASPATSVMRNNAMQARPSSPSSNVQTVTGGTTTTSGTTPSSNSSVASPLKNAVRRWSRRLEATSSTLFEKSPLTNTTARQSVYVDGSSSSESTASQQKSLPSPHTVELLQSSLAAMEDPKNQLRHVQIQMRPAMRTVGVQVGASTRHLPSSSAGDVGAASEELREENRVLKAQLLMIMQRMEDMKQRLLEQQQQQQQVQN